MRARQLTPNVVQLTRLRFVNAYLVREDDGFTLVDTTVPRGAGKLLDAAKEAGAPIRRIALAHGHGDHRLARRAQRPARRCAGGLDARAGRTGSCDGAWRSSSPSRALLNAHFRRVGIDAMRGRVVTIVRDAQRRRPAAPDFDERLRARPGRSGT
jgi:metallo-beta-lactamase superfamily protein